MSDIRNWCCGPDGRPDFEKMKAFMHRHDLRSRFDAAGWALFFIWVGIAWLADVSVGVGLLGVAVEGFWILVGIGFAIAGLWQWFAIKMPLAPFVLIAAGVALLVWRVWPRGHHRSS